MSGIDHHKFISGVRTNLGISAVCSEVFGLLSSSAVGKVSGFNVLNELDVFDGRGAGGQDGHAPA